MERKACVPTHECFEFNDAVMGELKLCWEKGKTESVESWGRRVC